ncbi:cytochrome c oxidase subunit 3 [Sphingomonas bacterium]|uniref:cytochrome c oxidase subunit 3 n=1 Tax=Sphingomonas bacterium TaxID=1895847 RepID=UPI001575DEB3|nr:cytochrome c oxidase subunit 3 [Sphingomonas bacterium]
MTAPEAALNEPWEARERQHAAMLFGLWVFLASEILFFGGLFLLYAHARLFDNVGFTAGGRAANAWFGTANTLVLMTSSLTMALAERATRAGWTRLARFGLWATIALGLVFLVVKGFEYHEDLAEHLFPGRRFRFAQPGAAQFWSFYWTITIVHATHLTIGLGFVTRLLLLDRRGALGRRWMGAEVTTVYWHLVDVVWVILYPLLYLVGR